MINKTLNIGLFGYGTVGKGLYTILTRTPSLAASISKIVIKNITKKRDLASEYFSDNAENILEDETINVVVELISDAEAAYNIVSSALKKGKAVVSANKKMIAAHLPEFLSLQNKFGGILLYEGACCASIPIIRNLEEYYDNDMLRSLAGIVNGSTNFILTRMTKHGEELEEALLPAQQLGFAELDPSLDIEGHDAANKLSILLTHAFGIIKSPEDLLYTGIQNLTAVDIKLAKEKNLVIKLVAQVQRLDDETVSAYVLPQFVETGDELYQVENEFNGIVTESSFADRQFFKGKGAGSFPTASAVLSDIAALRYDYRYAYKKLVSDNIPEISTNYFLKVYVSSINVSFIKKNDFESIEEFYTGNNLVWLTGYINAENLIKNNWWRQPGVSLITFHPGKTNNVEQSKKSYNNIALAKPGIAGKKDLKNCLEKNEIHLADIL